MTDVILDPFHRALAVVIREEIATKTEALINGSATRTAGDAITVAEKYAAQVAHIRALGLVLEMCKQVEDDQNTLQPRKADVTVRER